MTALQTNDAYDELFDRYGQIYNVDPALTKTVFHLESSGNPATPNSKTGAIGGMQIEPALAQHYGIDPRDMTQAIPAATAYLAEGLQATGGDPAGALAYYNGGPKTLQRWKPETQAYVAKAQSYYPQIKLAANNPAPGTASDSPSGVIPAAAPPPDLNAFRQEWGLGDSAPQSAPDLNAFRKEWGLNPPANSNAPGAAKVAPQPNPTPGTQPKAASDAASSAPDNLDDTALTTAQIAESRARAAQGPYSALEPSEPGFAHLLWSMGAGPMQLGETALGYKPIPTGINALEAALPLAGVGDLRGAIPPRGVPAPSGNPLGVDLAANPVFGQPEAPAPSFTAPTGRMFDVDAQGNVSSGNPLAAARPAPASAPPPLRPPTPEPAANPLSTEPAAPATPRAAAALALSPTEEAAYASLNAPKALPGAPAGAPPGTPPLGEPGYTPSTPGASPAGLSPTEAAAYAAMHDTPPPSPMIPPLTQSAADKLADEVVRYFHTGNKPEELPVPPGYHPTLTGLTMDPGLATLHRGLEGVSGTPAVVAQHNAAAINTARAALQGEPGDVAAMEAARDAITGPMRDAAFSNATDADPKAVQAVSDAAGKILSGPDGKRPGVVKYVSQIRDAMRSDTGNGAPETDPEMLYGVHKAVNDLLSPLAQSTDADKQAAAASLMKLKPLLQTAIESGAPGFKAYMQTHAEMSKPIDAARYLQSLNLTDSNGATRLPAVDSAIKNITKQQQLPGVPKAKWVSDDQLEQLERLRNALRMEAARGTGKPVNSTTFQNLATNSKVSQIAGSPLSAIGGALAFDPSLVGYLAGQAAGAGVKATLARSEDMVRRALAERLLNLTGKGVEALKPPPKGPGAPWNPLNAGPAPPPGDSAPGAPWNTRP